jgi:GAF domain-containing protein
MIGLLNKFWQKIASLGLEQVSDMFVNQSKSIKITNQLAGIYIAVSIFALFTDYSIWLNELNLVRYVALIGGGLLIWVLNLRQFFLTSRVFTVLFPIFCFFLPPVLLHQVNDLQLIWFPFGLIIISIAPLKLFDLKTEKRCWIPLSVFYFLLILSFEYLFWLADSGVVERYPSIYQNIYNYKIIQISLWAIAQIFFYSSAYTNYLSESRLIQTNQTLNKQIQTSKALLEEIQTQNEELKQSQEEIASQRDQITAQKNHIIQSNERMAYFQTTLMNLTLSNPIQLGKWEESVNIITHLASVSARVSRVSIWEYIPNEDKILCLTLYNAKQQNHELGMQLYATDFPAYFKAIARRELIVASDAHTHPVTSEFSESYLKPLNINAMLDAPFFVDGELKGVICFEHQDSLREWSMEEISFAKSLADIITIAYKSMLRRLDIEQIQRQNQEISFQNQILLQQKEFIDTINQSLEARIKERTQKLEWQNQQLAEYTFINAHHLRGPLCRIIGLINLMEIPEYRHETGDFIAKIRIATEELDSVIRTINQRLEEGSNLEVEDLQHLRQNNFQSIAPNLMASS